jgi:hypothetical protein
MGIRYAIGIALSLFAVSGMAEPPQRHSAAPRQGAPVKPGAASPAPLKLQIGDVRKYMMPNEYRAAVNAPDPDKGTIVVEGRRELLPMKSQQPVPGGLIAPFWAIAHPTQAWRVLVPDPNAAAAGPPDVVPKQEFRWGP